MSVSTIGETRKENVVDTSNWRRLTLFINVCVSDALRKILSKEENLQPSNYENMTVPQLAKRISKISEERLADPKTTNKNKKKLQERKDIADAAQTLYNHVFNIENVLKVSNNQSIYDGDRNKIKSVLKGPGYDKNLFKELQIVPLANTRVDEQIKAFTEMYGIVNDKFEHLETKSGSSEDLEFLKNMVDNMESEMKDCVHNEKWKQFREDFKKGYDRMKQLIADNAIAIAGLETKTTKLETISSDNKEDIAKHEEKFNVLETRLLNLEKAGNEVNEPTTDPLQEEGSFTSDEMHTDGSSTGNKTDGGGPSESQDDSTPATIPTQTTATAPTQQPQATTTTVTSNPPVTTSTSISSTSISTPPTTSLSLTSTPQQPPNVGVPLTELKDKHTAKIAAWLDSNDTMGIPHWHFVAEKLFAGEEDKLTKIADLYLHMYGGGNPGLKFLTVLGTRKSTLTCKDFCDIALDEDITRNDIAICEFLNEDPKKLLKQIGYANELKLAALLNSESGIPDWAYFADELDFPNELKLEIRHQAKSENSTSPTKKLIEILKLRSKTTRDLKIGCTGLNLKKIEDLLDEIEASLTIKSQV